MIIFPQFIPCGPVWETAIGVPCDKGELVILIYLDKPRLAGSASHATPKLLSVASCHPGVRPAMNPASS